jgi:FkbM family methyltransferase
MKQPYERLDRKLNIIDVGCRWGFADNFLKYLDDVNLLGFDPDEAECKRLKDDFTSRTGSNSLKLFPYALGDEVGTKTLYITKDPGSSSLFLPRIDLHADHPTMRNAQSPISTAEVWTTRFDNIVEVTGCTQPDFIKLDTQGYELNILKGFGEYLPKARALKIEVEFNEMYEGQPLFANVDHFMRQNGFVLWKLQNLVHYGVGNENIIPTGKDSIHYDEGRTQQFRTYGGQLYWADAIYVNKSVLDTSRTDVCLLQRDELLFEMLGLTDLETRMTRRLFQLGVTE